MEQYASYVKKAFKLGADDARVIGAGSIVTGPWVRWKCRYGCGMYGSSLCCPPHSPDYRETGELIGSYAHALLIRYKKGFRSKTHPTAIASTLARDLFLAGYYRAFALGEGPCMLCRKCALERCVHPDKARPSMEACGIDVYRTARNNGFSVHVLTEDFDRIMAGESCDINRYGLVLIE